MAVLISLAQQILANGGTGEGGSQTPWTSDINAANFNLNNLGLINGVKVYRALLTQSGTDAPNATVLENSVGPAIWTRVGSGDYRLTLAGAFPQARSFYRNVVGVYIEDPVGFLNLSQSTDDFISLAESGGRDDSIAHVAIEILVYTT